MGNPFLMFYNMFLWNKNCSSHAVKVIEKYHWRTLCFREVVCCKPDLTPLSILGIFQWLGVQVKNYVEKLFAGSGS